MIFRAKFNKNNNFLMCLLICPHLYLVERYEWFCSYTIKGIKWKRANRSVGIWVRGIMYSLTHNIIQYSRTYMHS